MIELELLRIADNDVLHAFPKGAQSESLPCIVFYHGFTSSNIVYSYFAVALAQAGFRVIMPEAEDHGSRFGGDESRRLTQFWQILLTNFQSFPAIRDDIIARGWGERGRIGVAGASMGGMTALGIMTRHPDIRCVASLMGSGYFSQLSSSLFPPEPSAQPEVRAALAEWDVNGRWSSLAARPLLLWHGEDDDVVPAGESHRLHQAMMQQGLDDNMTCRWQAGVRHRITPEALAETVAFFEKHL